MSGKHSEITDAVEIHVPKGFTEASNTTAPIRNEVGDLEWRSISELGGTGPAGTPGPAGSSLTTRFTSVRAATTGPINLNSDLEIGDSIDGVTLAFEDLILVKDQTDGTENGIYQVTSSSTPIRAAGASSSTALSAGSYSWVLEGTTNAAKRFQLATSSVVGIDIIQVDLSEDLQDLPPIDFVSDISLTGAQSHVNINNEVGNGSGTTFTLDLSKSNNHMIDLQDFSGDVTLTISNPKDGGVYSLLVIQGSTSRNIIWPSSVEFAGGSAPTITTTNNKADLITLYYVSALTKFIASASQDFATT